MTKIATNEQRTRAIAFMEQMALPMDWECRPWKAPRTLPQNAYLWAAVYAPLVELCGFTPEEWHSYFCQLHFGTVEHVKPSGEVDCRPLRTTTKNEHGKRDVLKGKAFADFVTFVESECAKRGVFVLEEWKE